MAKSGRHQVGKDVQIVLLNYKIDRRRSGTTSSSPRCGRQGDVVNFLGVQIEVSERVAVGILQNAEGKAKQPERAPPSRPRRRRRRRSCCLSGTSASAARDGSQIHPHSQSIVASFTSFLGGIFDRMHAAWAFVAGSFAIDIPKVPTAARSSRPGRRRVPHHLLGQSRLAVWKVEPANKQASVAPQPTGTKGPFLLYA